MNDSGVSHDVREMVLRHLPTLDHIELLAVLRDGREESFSRAALVAKIRKPDELIHHCLDSLAGAGLVAELSDGNYRYAARDKAFDEAADAVIKLYNERPVTLVRLLYERPPTAVNTFADAFKLRKTP